MIIRRVAGAAADRAGATRTETQAVSSFLRGLTAGALIGAAIAGSALLEWRRRRAAEDATDREAQADHQDAG
jgi:hypothetical protein